MRSLLRDRAWLRQLDRRVLWGGAGAAAIVLVGVAGFVLARPMPAPEPVGTSEPTTVPTVTPPRARATPPGTPAPRPAAPVGISASIPVEPPPGPSTPSPQPGLWRIEGYVVDESGQPLENVCVVIGPVGCRPFSPHTDERGHYFIDVASAPVSATVSVALNFYFEMPGRETVWMRVLPTSSTFFNLVLRKT